MKEIKDFVLEYFFVLTLTLALGFFFWAYKPEQTISLSTLLWTVTPLFLLTIFLIKYIFHIQNKIEKPNIAPRLITVTEHPYCIFGASEIFSIQSFVSIYHTDEVEILVAYGKVDAIITNTKNLQISITNFIDNYSHEKLRLHRKNIIVKPTLPHDLMERAAYSQLCRIANINSNSGENNND